jgi:hypothetical protein
MKINVLLNWVVILNPVTLVHSYYATCTFCNPKDRNADSHIVLLVGSNFTEISKDMNQVRIVEWIVMLFLICVNLYSFTDK